MVKLPLFVLALCLSFTPAWLTDPCHSYTELLSDSRRGSGNVQKIGEIRNGFCDISLKAGWFRLKMGPKDIDLVTSAPSVGACNTAFPIWMRGEVPSDLNQQITTTACIVSPTDKCARTLPVKVKNCGLYRVYELQPPPFCSSAYCFGDFPTILIKPLVAPVLGNSTTDPTYEDLRFECRFTSPDPSYFYDVVWRIDGEEVTRIIRVSGADLPEAAQLLETVWTGQYKLGMNIQCSVRVNDSAPGEPSPEHNSQYFFAGLKVLNASVNLIEGDSTSILFQSTVPVPCPINTPCSVRFIGLRADANNGCNTTEKGNCGFDVSSENWMAIHELEVTAKFDSMFGSRISQLFLSSTPPAFSSPKHVWVDVKPQPVVINIVDKDVLTSGSYCTIQNDPHFRSFDGRKFDVQLAGEFVLYRHKTLPIEVRGFFQPCGTIPRCICGAAVRSGEQIFVFSTCKDNLAYHTTRVRVYGCNRKQMRVTTPDKGVNYKVDLPTGVVVEIRNGFVKIIPSPADVGQVMGLCGNFNGNKEDEYIDSNGTQHSNNCDFLYRRAYCVVNKYGKTWKIQTTEESYYGYPDIGLSPAPVGQCSCTSLSGEVSPNVTCTNISPQQCGTLDPDVTDEYCTQIPPSSTRRKKRQADNSDGLIEDDARPVFPLYKDTEFKVPKWSSGWDEQKARQHCVRFFQRSPAFQPCSKVGNVEMDRNIDFCTIDVLLSGTTEWTLSSLEFFKHNCRSEVRRNTTLWMSEGGAASILDQVMETSCPNECSFHGKCVKGKCRCNAGWIGDDCSVDINTPPKVLGLPRGGLCDLKYRTCDRTVVYGMQFVSSEHLTCKFVPVSEDKETAKENTTAYLSEPVFRHSGEVVCILPPYLRRAYPAPSSEPRGYYISVSNDNGVFSEPRLFLPFDSDDFICYIYGLNFTCVNLKNDTSAHLLVIPNFGKVLLCRNGESVRIFRLPSEGGSSYDGYCSRADQVGVEVLQELEPSNFPTIGQIVQATMASVVY